MATLQDLKRRIRLPEHADHSKEPEMEMVRRRRPRLRRRTDRADAQLPPPMRTHTPGPAAASLRGLRQPAAARANRACAISTLTSKFGGWPGHSNRQCCSSGAFRGGAALHEEAQL